MNPSQIKNDSSFLCIFRYFLLIVFVVIFLCCEKEEGCEFEMICYTNGGCIEKPIPGTCF